MPEFHLFAIIYLWSLGFCVGGGWAKGKEKRQTIQVVPETGLGPCSALIQALGMGRGRKYFIGETNVGRVHKTLLHFLSGLPQWGDFLEPSLGPPYWGGAGRGEG